MLENALKGSKKYWGTLVILAGFAGIGSLCYLRQLVMV